MMVIFLIILYLMIGAIVSFSYKYLVYLWKDVIYGKGIFDSWDDDRATSIAIVSGVLWPIVAPFSFAMLLSKYIPKRDESVKRND